MSHPMTKRDVLVAAVLFTSLSANRSIPKWQASGNVSLVSAERCVAAQLAHFGRVRVQRGEEPEAGKVRLFLRQSVGGKLRTTATVYLNGEQGFSALWMDAQNDRLGTAVWRDIRHHCRVR